MAGPRPADTPPCSVGSPPTPTAASPPPRHADKQLADREEDAYRYVNRVLALIRSQLQAAAHGRFLEDFGPDALDLWPAHLQSLGLTAPLHPRTLWGLIAIALEHGHPVVGQTLDTPADFEWNQHRNRAAGEWHPGPGRVALAGHGHIVVPPPVNPEQRAPRM